MKHFTKILFVLLLLSALPFGAKALTPAQTCSAGKFFSAVSSGGTYTCGTPSGGGGSAGGTWSTTTSSVPSRLINYPNNTSDIVVVGNTATTTAKYWFDPNTQISYMSGLVGFGSTTPWGQVSINPNLIGAGPSFVVGSSTATNFIINNAGRVGIGTSTPGTLLSVQGIANFNTATSTFQSSGGINLTSGCFAIGGTCISGSGGAGTPGGASSTVQYNANGAFAGNTGLVYTGTNLGIGTTSPFEPLSVAGNGWFGGTAFHVGTTSGTYITGRCTNAAAACSELIGQDNTTAGISNIIQNTTGGNNSYVDFVLFNDNPNGLANFGALILQSSTYNSTAFGTAFAYPNQIILQNTFGPLTIAATGAGQNINFVTGGSATTNIRSTITSGGAFGIGITNPGATLELMGTTTDSTSQNLIAWNSAGVKLLQLDNQGDFDTGSSSAAGFHVINNVNTAGNGLNLTTSKSGSGVLLQVISSATNENLGILTKGTGSMTLTVGSGGNFAVSLGGTVLSASAGALTFTHTFRNATAVPGFTYTAIGTSLTANTEAPSTNFINGAALTHANSNSGITLQRDFLITAATHSFAGFNGGKNVFTDLATLGLTGAPIVPTTGNGTTTRASTIYTGASALNASTTASYAIYALSNTGAVSNYGAYFQGAVGIGSTSPLATALSTNGTNYMTGLTTSAGLQTAILCLDANGQVISESVACVASAARYKENVRDLPVGLDELLKLRPVSFTWKKDYLGNNVNDPNQNGVQYSLIADEVQKVDPHLVSVTTGTTTFEGKEYHAGTVQGLADQNHWNALFVKSIQELALRTGTVAVRSVEENWQWGAIALLALWNLALTVKRKK